MQPLLLQGFAGILFEFARNRRTPNTTLRAQLDRGNHTTKVLAGKDDSSNVSPKREVTQLTTHPEAQVPEVHRGRLETAMAK
jgi:hypothetical protein